MEYRTRVHIAEPQNDGVQKCFRCGEILADSRGAMSMDGRGYPFWKSGGYVGVVERVDGRAVYPKGYCLMDHDATESDEIRCGNPS